MWRISDFSELTFNCDSTSFLHVVWLSKTPVLALVWTRDYFVEEKPIEDDIILPIFALFWMDSSTYLSVTVLDFHPPRRFNDITSTPESASSVAAVRRKACPV